jgi:uncharacterized protein YjbJ (UPF0337 family)
LIYKDKKRGTAVASQGGTQAIGACQGKQELQMNWDRIEGNWKQLKGKVKEQWGKLTDDHIDNIAGKRDQLVGKLQEQYGISKDEADRQIGLFENRYGNYTPTDTIER